MNRSPLTRTVTVRNRQGLHARPADMLVRLANQFQSDLHLSKSGEWVDCKSILSVLTLGATQGTELSVSADGDDAADALQAIGELFETGFDEPNEVEDAESTIDS